MIKKSELLSFLKEIDNDFPTPLSQKVNLDEYVDKVLENAEIITKRINSEIAGITIFYCNDFVTLEAHAVVTGVKQKYRRMGIGKYLKEKQIETVKEKGFKKLIFYTENPIAERLYKSLGGKVIDIDSNGRVKMEILFN